MLRALGSPEELLRKVALAGHRFSTAADLQAVEVPPGYDMNDVARQLAIAPAPGSRAEKAMVALQRLQARMLRRRSA